MIPAPRSDFQKVKLSLHQGVKAAECNAPDRAQEIFRRALNEAKQLPNNTAGMLLRAVCIVKCLRNGKFSDTEFLENFNILKENVEKLDCQLSHQRDSHPYLDLLGTTYLYLYIFTTNKPYIKKAKDILVRVARNKAEEPKQPYPSPQARAQFDAFISAGLSCLYLFREELDNSENDQIDIQPVLQAVSWFEKAFSIYPKSESLIYLLGLSSALLDHLVSLQPPQYPQPPLQRSIEILHYKEDEKMPDPLQRLFLLGVCQYRAAFNQNNPHQYELLTLGIQAYDTLFRTYKGDSGDRSFKGDSQSLVFVADSARWLYWMTRLPFYQQKAAFFIAQLKTSSPASFLFQVVVKVYEIQNHLIKKTVDKIPALIDELRALLKTQHDDSTVADSLLTNLREGITLITTHFQKLKNLQEPEYDFLATRLGNKINALAIYSLSTNAIYKELNSYNQLPDLEESLIE